MNNARDPESDRPGAALLYAALGFFALTAQTLLFRWFFETFEGSELGIAAFFTSWLVWVALGAALGRRGGATSSVARVAAVSLAYLPAFLVQAWLLRHARPLAGLTSYELFPLLRLLPAAFLAAAPVSALTGWLFTAACAAAARAEREDGSRFTVHGSRLPAVPRIYALEALGGALGGVFATLALAVGCTEERVFLLSAAVLAAAAAPVFPRRGPRVTTAVAGLALALAAAAGLDGMWSRAADRALWSRRLPGGAYEGRFATPQAVYRFGSYRDAFVVLARESVEESVPDEPRAAEIAALHLAAAPDARRVLVIGPGALALCSRFLDVSQIEQVCWLHPDPGYPVALLARLPPALRPDPARFRVPGLEARAALRADTNRYDLIVLTVPDPFTLPLNRYGTAEFFALLAPRLAPDGVVSLRFSGGENFLGDASASLGAAALATLQTVWPHILLKPGDESWLLASAKSMDRLTPRLLARRFGSVGGASALGRPELVLSLFPPGRAELQLDRHRQVIASAPPGAWVNTDAQPRAPALALRLALAQGGFPNAADGLALFGRPLAWTLIAAALLWLLLRAQARRGRGREGLPSYAGTASAPAVGRETLPSADGAPAERGAGREGFPSYVDATSAPAVGRETLPSADASALAAFAGAGGMAFSLFLMHRYQARFGELFLHAGLLSALFMLGLFLGAALVARVLARRGESRFALPVVVAAHLGLLALLQVSGEPAGRIVYLAFFVAGGLVCGAYVPLAARRLRAAGLADAAAGARLEALDHVGGAVGGLAAGLLWLPLLGAAGTPWALAALALAGLTAAFGAAPVPAGDRADRAARALGHVAFALAVLAVFFAAAVRRERAAAAGDPLLRLAQEMRADVAWRTAKAERPNAPPVEYLAAAAGGDEAKTEYVFRTDRFAGGISGYAGPIVLALRIGADGTLRETRVLQSAETPSYFARTLKWRTALAGRNVFTPDAWTKVDGVSGATVSVRAMAQTIREAGAAFAHDVLKRGEGATAAPRRFDREATALAVLFAAAWLLRRQPAVWPRRLLLLATVASLGVWMNVQFSTFQLSSLLRGAAPSPGWTLSFALMVAVPLAVLLFGNTYCGWLCPFGALQELIGEFRPARWRTEPHPLVWRYGRWVKYALLFALVGAALGWPEAPVTEADPLTRFFAGDAGPRLAALAAAVLALSLVYRRFWCRNLCPAGAFLAILGGARPFARWLPAVQPGRCDLGVRRKADLDCLVCDRCRQSRDTPKPGAFAGAGRREFVYLAVVAVCTVWVVADAGRAARDAELRAAVEATGAVDPAVTARLREKIKAGLLSDREALYYRGADGPTAEGGRTRKNH